MSSLKFETIKYVLFNLVRRYLYKKCSGTYIWREQSMVKNDLFLFGVNRRLIYEAIFSSSFHYINFEFMVFSLENL